jgi:hypothetical protein
MSNEHHHIDQLYIFPLSEKKEKEKEICYLLNIHHPPIIHLPETKPTITTTKPVNPSFPITTICNWIHIYYTQLAVK